MTSPGAVLVVDDDRSMLVTLQEVLELEGFRCFAASSAREAADLAMDRPFAVALIDINMPGVNGIEALRQIRAIQPDVAAILMTAYPFPEAMSGGASPAVDAVLSKPLDIHQLILLLNKHCAP